MHEHRSIIDTDIHSGIDNDRLLVFLPEPWRTRYADGNRGSQPIGYWNPHGVMRPDAVLEDGSRIEASPHGLARHFLDVYGIEYGILNSGNLHLALSPEPDFAAAVTSAGNDVVAHDWLTADPRYRSSLTVSPLDPELAAKEIHRLGDHPGFVQVLLPSAARMPYGQRYYHPIYAAAVEHNLAVAIHPGTEGTGVSGSPTAAGYPSSYFEWHTGLVGSYLAHLVSLISEGVFTKFPTLRFVLIEGGVFWIPPLLWRFDKNWKSLRMTAPWVDRLPSEIARDHILVTTQPLEEPPEPRHFAMMLELFDGGNMLMFSSDYPHWDGDTPDFAIRHFPPELRPRVMSETARELYRLPQQAAHPNVSSAADAAEVPHA